MATADDIIRARVKAADEARIASRGDRAAAVADVHSRRAAALAELDRIETELTAAVRSATQVMSLEELVGFADVPRADLAGKTTRAATSVKARSPKTRRRTTRSTPAASEPPAGPDA